jgi:hypothetical protein
MAATYLTLAECRDQVNIKDDTFTEDDSYLQWLAEAAEISVQNRINQDLSDLENESGALPTDLHLGCLFLVATWYKKRENTVEGTITTPYPYAMDDILQDYIKRKIG